MGYRGAATAIATAIASLFTPSVHADQPGDLLGNPITVWEAPSGNNFPPYTLYVSPAVASDGTGNFVVVWVDDSFSIVGRRFTADGRPLGDVFQIKQGEPPGKGWLMNPQVAMDRDGDFVVTWSDVKYGWYYFSGPCCGGGVLIDVRPTFVHARSYTRNGETRSPDVLVGAEPLESVPISQFFPWGRVQPKVAMDDDGDFAITWTSTVSTPQIWAYVPAVYATTQAIYVRQFDGQGSPKGTAAVVSRASRALSTLSPSKPRLLPYGTWVSDPSIGMDGVGNFTIAWMSDEETPKSVTRVNARSYTSNGEAVGPKFQVNTSEIALPYRNQFPPPIAMNQNGQYAIAWAGCSTGVCAQHFLSGDQAVSTEIPVGDDIQGQIIFSGEPPTIAIDPAGNFTVASALAGETSDYDLLNYGRYVRFFNADGTPLSGNRTLTEVSPDSPEIPGVSVGIAMSPTGETVAAYLSQAPTPPGQIYVGYSILLQRINSPITDTEASGSGGNGNGGSGGNSAGSGDGTPSSEGGGSPSVIVLAGLAIAAIARRRRSRRPN